MGGEDGGGGGLGGEGGREHNRSPQPPSLSSATPLPQLLQVCTDLSERLEGMLALPPLYSKETLLSLTPEGGVGALWAMALQLISRVEGLARQGAMGAHLFACSVAEVSRAVRGGAEVGGVCLRSGNMRLTDLNDSGCASW